VVSYCRIIGVYAYVMKNKMALVTMKDCERIRFSKT
jgi:hypothetical protein